MSKHGLATKIEDFIWESPIERYPLQHESQKSLEDVDHTDDLAGKSSYDDAIDGFIDRFCIQQIKNKIPLKDLINTIEKIILTKVLSRFGGHQKAASQFLRIKNTTLHEKLKKHHIRFSKTVQ